MLLALPVRDAFALDSSIVFLNHGSFGACPKAVLAKQADLRGQLEAEPVRFFERHYEALLDEALAVLGRFVGAKPNDLAAVANTTQGVNGVLRSISLLPGDEVLTTNHAYNACRQALDAAAARSGASVVVAPVPFPLSGAADHDEAVLARVTPHTRLVLLDHVTSPTALCFDLHRLVADLEARGVMVLVDGAHAPGMVELRLDALGASFYVGNLHKWVCAPKGAAFLHVRADRQRLIRPLAISHGAASPRVDRSRFRLEHDWVGTVDPTAFLSVPTALEVVAKLAPGGWPGVRATNRAMVIEARELLVTTLKTQAPAPESLLGAMATVLVPETPALQQLPPARDWDSLHEALFTRHSIEVPVFRFGDRRYLRISAQRYNTWADYQQLAQALTETLGL